METLHDILSEPNAIVAFLRLEERYRIVDAAERSYIREGWDFGRRWHLIGLDYPDLPGQGCVMFNPLFGEDAHGLDAEARLEVRLSYHSIENARSDFRDNLLDLCLCYHCAIEAGLDVVQLFEEAAAISGDYMASLIRGFLIWPPENKSLWAYGFRKVSLANGLAFEDIVLADNYMSQRPSHLDEWGRVTQVTEN